MEQHEEKKLTKFERAKIAFAEYFAALKEEEEKEKFGEDLED